VNENRYSLERSRTRRRRGRSSAAVSSRGEWLVIDQWVRGMVVTPALPETLATQIAEMLNRANEREVRESE
jgi:hypothetical protein